jgi:hypothetical protein
MIIEINVGANSNNRLWFAKPIKYFGIKELVRFKAYFSSDNTITKNEINATIPERIYN